LFSENEGSKKIKRRAGSLIAATAIAATLIHRYVRKEETAYQPSDNAE